MLFVEFPPPAGADIGLVIEVLDQVRLAGIENVAVAASKDRR